MLNFGIVQLEPSALRQILDMFEGETAMLTINECCIYAFSNCFNNTEGPDIIHKKNLRWSLIHPSFNKNTNSIRMQRFVQTPRKIIGVIINQVCAQMKFYAILLF